MRLLPDCLHTCKHILRHIRSARSCLRNLASCVAVAKATYLASQLGNAITDCFLVFYDTSELS